MEAWLINATVLQRVREATTLESLHQEVLGEVLVFGQKRNCVLGRHLVYCVFEL